MNEIASRSNAKFKTWLSLLEAKGIKSEGLCLVSGPKIVGEILRERPDQVVEILLPPKSIHPAANLNLPATRLTGNLFNELDVIGTKTPLAVVRTQDIGKWTGEAAQGLVVVAAMSDPQNLGALIRSAEAFGAHSVVLTKESASPFLPRSLRAASGSAFRVRLLSGPALRELSVERGFGLDLKGQDISNLDWPKNSLLIVGEEGKGLPEDLNLTRVKIPMASSIDSLNAAMAASIALFSYRQRFPLKG